MTLGPAPVQVKPPEKPIDKSVEKPIENKALDHRQHVTVKEPVKTEPRKPGITPAPLRPDPRIVSTKFKRPEPPAPPKSDLKPEVKAPEARLEVKAEPKPEIKPEVKEQPKVAVPAAKQVTKVETPAAPKPPAKPEVKTESKPEIRADKNEDKKPEVKEKKTETPPPASYPSSDLGLPKLNIEQQGFWAKLPIVAKIGIAAVLIAGVGVFISFSSKTGGAAVNPSGPGTVIAGSALPAGDAGWITDWGAEPGVRRTRQISVLRSSQTLTDYRIEMQGQIESKAIGWIFRAADPKNFYVTKLEIVKPGLEPTVAVVRFAMVNGEEGPHAQLPLPMKVRRDTMFKIRFDAVGSHFTTYVLDQKVDDWTDEQVKTGGVGLYSERGEVAALKGGMNVVPLIVKK
jgi:hypothetical protein